ncbi:MAG: aminotransferase class I/II-fold pyridoxal phosphate-dependent enzyme, partial [Gammaproteobacteria bacterium]|nr:aminotransferase class I/II-fold pyridoxal phosphate-dependent enzyme [Gammaproteobacteria bacterium]
VDRTVTINGVSKAYAMTGWRIGYAAGPEPLIRAMKTIQSQSTSNPCSISQVATIAALDGDQSVVADMCAAYRERHDYLVGALNGLPGFECRAGEGAFYAFPRITGAMQAVGTATDTEFVEWLLTTANIACVPGSAFGAPGYLRLSFACSIEVLQDAADRLKRALSA